MPSVLHMLRNDYNVPYVPYTHTTTYKMATIYYYNNILHNDRNVVNPILINAILPLFPLLCR